MALEVTRLYKNAGADILRVDSIYMDPTSNTLNTGIGSKTYYRRLNSSYMYGPADRVVASIEVITSADDADTSTDIEWVEWTTRSQTIRCDMSDLPKVADTV